MWVIVELQQGIHMHVNSSMLCNAMQLKKIIIIRFLCVVLKSEAKLWKKNRLLINIVYLEMQWHLTKKHMLKEEL